ncbi:Methionine aminopeptidase 2, partial [Coemansia sp. RSA 2530]
MSVADSTTADLGLAEKKLGELAINNSNDNNGEKGTYFPESDDDDDEEDGGEGEAGEKTQKKKRKNKKKNKKKKKTGLGAAGQTSPPSIPVSQLFPNNSYSEGQICEYVDDNKYRTTSEEMRAKDRLNEQQLVDLRRAAEVHREVRQYARANIRPGMDLTTIAEMIENGTRALVEEQGFESGVGFPTGLSLNHCAAHYTPNAGDFVEIKEDDVLKVDFGVHVNGHIIDSAFTMSWNDRYKPLLDAVKEATNTGVREAGIDVRLGDIGAAIQEVMESYEIELDGKVLPVKPIRNL